MNALWAGLPIIVALGCMAARLPATSAGALALVVAIGVALLPFDTGLSQLLSAEVAMGGVMVEVALILFGGLLLNALLQQAGSQTRLGRVLIDRTGDPGRSLVLIVLGIIPFAESVTGFAVGAVIGIPLLREIGLSPRRAAICGLLGLVIVPWGSLGPGTLVAARLAGVDYQALGITSALLSGVVFLVMGAAALWIGLGRRAFRLGLFDLLRTALALWLGVWLVNRTIGTPLAGVLGSAFAIAVTLAFARFARRRPETPAPWPLADCGPYLVLVGGLLVTHLLPVWGALRPWQAVVGSPATWLLITAAITPLLLSCGSTPTPAVLRSALRQWRPVAITTLLFLALGVVLAAGHMSDALAQASAQLGAAYPAVAPWIGALGGFLAGSNTGASAMFATSQAQTATAIGYPVLMMVGLQNVGASLAIMAALPKIVMATTVAVASAGGSYPTSASPEPPSIASVLWPILLIDAFALSGLSAIAVLI